MDEEAFNRSIRKFLKVVGVTSQREIEKRVREAVASGDLKDARELAVHATVELEKFGVVAKIDSKVFLEHDPSQDEAAV